MMTVKFGIHPFALGIQKDIAALSNIKSLLAFFLLQDVFRQVGSVG